MEAINNHAKLKLLVVAAGMHFSKEFGKTIDLIKKDGFKISSNINMNPEKDTAESMAISIGRGIISMTKAFIRKKPDIILVLGDRIEALAGAVVSSYLNILLGHIHGGDISQAGLDESARHAITKFAHIHFPATKQSMGRIIKMGEDPKMVFLVGAPGLDGIYKEQLLTKQKLAKKYALDLSKPLAILLQHSVTTQIDQARKQIRATLDAIKGSMINTVAIYPNSDAGGRTIIKEIERSRNLFVRIFKSLPRSLYLSLLNNASVLIGNSSSGIIETPSFNLPVINIGMRQGGRERSTNVIDVPHEKNAIILAIKKALYDKKFMKCVKRCKNPYDDGHAARKIVKVLSTVKLDKKMLQKQMSY
jgi:UDP-hydrolysing UDP-N-acetyl-D-glucosamine 2-epimerase